MKKIAVFLYFIIHSYSFAQQQGSITIDWNEKTTYSNSDFSVKIPQFNSDSFNYDDSKKQLLYSLKIPSSNLINENSLQITNIIYETIDEVKLGELSKKNIPKTIKAKVENCISRDKIIAILSFSPIIKEENSYKKILSLTYNFTYQTNLNRSNTPPNNVTSITNSVLSSGAWYRFYVEKSGIYQISKSFLNELGLGTDGVDPKKIKIYGSGGRMVPLANSTPYPNDLEENAIQVVGEADGVFNNEDYILFYAEGTDNWSDENKTHINLYSDKAYYYITTNGGFGKRIAPFVEPTASSTVTLTSYDDYKFHEVDLNNIGRLGRVWFGESFNIEDEQEFTFSFPTIVPSATTTINIHVGGNAFVATKFITTVNAQSLPNMLLGSVQLN